MTTIARLTRAELRKLVASRTFLIGLALSVGLAVVSVALDAIVAGKNGTPALGTAASTNQMLKLGVVCCVAMLVLGIIGSGGEYRNKTIIPAMLVAPRRGALIIAKVIGIAVAGMVLSVLTFGLGLATAVAELSAHHFHHLPADTGSLFAGSVIAGTLFGVIGVALGFITRSTIAAVVGAVGWVLFVETVILRNVAPHLAKWLVSGAASALTDPGVLASRALPPLPPSRSSAPTPWYCSRPPRASCFAAMWPDPPSRPAVAPPNGRTRVRWVCERRPLSVLSVAGWLRRVMIGEAIWEGGGGHGR